jgi:hypothetical protein
MIALAMERLLRGEAADAPGRRDCVVLGVAGSALLGAALGGSSGQPWLGVFAAIKVPLLLLCSTALCVPSFFVINTLLGLREDFSAACRALLAAQATLGLALGALAPVTVFLTLSVGDPYLLTLFDAVLFAAATWAGHQVLSRHYRPLLQRDARHRYALRAWIVLYAFAGMQLAWVLRPFRGTEGLPVQFLRPEAFEQNAYLVLIEHALRLWQ